MVQGVSIEKGYIVNLNPATGEAIQPKVKVSTNAEVDAAVAAAGKAQAAWTQRSLAERTELVKQAVKMHHNLVDASSQRNLEAHIGATPTVRDQGYAMSFWLAAACVALDGCKAQAAQLLASTSTADRAQGVHERARRYRLSSRRQVAQVLRRLWLGHRPARDHQRRPRRSALV